MRLVEHGRVEVAHVEVDRVAEQHELHRRDADDHRERQPVAPQLAQLLLDDRAEPPEVHAAFSFVSFGLLLLLQRRCDEHVLEIGRNRRDLRLDAFRAKSLADPLLEVRCGRGEHSQRRADLRERNHALDPGQRALSAPRIMRFDEQGAAWQPSRARAACRRRRSALRRESRAACSARPRPCSESTRAASCPASASSNRESQNSRRDCGSTALVGSSRNSESGLCSTVPASASRCLWPPLIVPASCVALLGEPIAFEQLLDPRARRAARRQLVHGREEVQVLEDREVLVEREALRHVADVALQRLGVARDLAAEHVDLAAASGAGGRRACGSSSTCPSRSDRGSRRPRRVHGEVEVVDGYEMAEALREPGRADRRLIGRATRRAAGGVGLRCAWCGAHGAFTYADTGRPAGRSAAPSPCSSSSAR